MEKKYGVYICTGCGIGDTLDMEALAGIRMKKVSAALPILSCVLKKV